VTVRDLRAFFRAARKIQPENRGMVRVLTRLRRFPADAEVPLDVQEAAIVWGDPITGCGHPRCRCRVAVA